MAHEHHRGRVHGLELDKKRLHVLFRVLGLQGLVDIIHLALLMVGPALDPHPLTAPVTESLSICTSSSKKERRYTEGTGELEQRTQGRYGLVALNTGESRLVQLSLGGKVLERQMLFLAEFLDFLADLELLGPGERVLAFIHVVTPSIRLENK